MQSGANGRDPEYRAGRSRTRFDWVRVPQVRVCDQCYSALAEKRDAFEALTWTAAALRPLATECPTKGWREMRKLEGRILGADQWNKAPLTLNALTAKETVARGERELAALRSRPWWRRLAAL